MSFCLGQRSDNTKNILFWAHNAETNYHLFIVVSSYYLHLQLQ